jgi:hypothetical protein
VAVTPVLLDTGVIVATTRSSTPEDHATGEILTLDKRGFRAYRFGRSKTFTTLP